MNQKIITTPLSAEVLEDMSENWLDNNSHLPQIPADVIAHHLAEAVNEQIENFSTNPQVSPRIEADIKKTIIEYLGDEYDPKIHDLS